MIEMSGRKNSFFASSKYLKFSAKKKMFYLMSEITADSRPGSFPKPSEMGGLFAESMLPVFDQAGDAMPEGRRKFIHSVGAVGKVKYVPSNKHFSGIFQGADIGLIRFSSAS